MEGPEGGGRASHSCCRDARSPWLPPEHKAAFNYSGTAPSFLISLKGLDLEVSSTPDGSGGGGRPELAELRVPMDVSPEGHLGRWGLAGQWGWTLLQTCGREASADTTHSL